MAIDSRRTEPELRLARDGGVPARRGQEPPMFPGGMEVGDEELRALERVVRSRNLFRRPSSAPSSGAASDRATR